MFIKNGKLHEVFSGLVRLNTESILIHKEALYYADSFVIEGSVVANIFKVLDSASALRGFLSIVGYSHFEISRASKCGKCRKITIVLKIQLSQYPKPDGFSCTKYLFTYIQHTELPIRYRQH